MNSKSKPNPIDIHVGSRVRFKRKILGITQRKLGDALGITFQQIQKYESGTNRIGSSRLYHISKILSVPVAFFFEDLPEEILKETDKLFKNDHESFATEKLYDNETINLLKSYYRIDSKIVRKNINTLIRSIIK